MNTRVRRSNWGPVLTVLTCSAIALSFVLLVWPYLLIERPRSNVLLLYVIIVPISVLDLVGYIITREWKYLLLFVACVGYLCALDLSNVVNLIPTVREVGS